MRGNFKASLLVAAVSAVGLVSAAQADSYVEQSYSTLGGPSTTVAKTTETVAQPVMEERTIERPVVIERSRMLEEHVRMHGNREKLKIKEYY